MRKSHRAAFTLVEVLVSAAILVLAAAGLTQAIVSSQALTREGLRHARATALAEALLEEVLALPYADPQGAGGPGPEPGEGSRFAFDNADDFNGFAESAGAIADASGAPYAADYEGLSREATAAYGTVTVAGFAGPIPGLTVSVVVRDAAGHAWVLTRFIPEPSD